MKYHHLVLTSFAVIGLLFLTACNGDESLAISETEARAQIMELHELQRTYHLEKMVEEFINQLSPNHISVNNGEIESPTKEELTQRFQNYFDTATFEKWDDLNPPIIKFSDDFSLAYTIVKGFLIKN